MGYSLGMVLGVLIGLLGAALIMKYIRKEGAVRCKFDERQELVRGRGFQYGFYTLLICMGIDICIGEFTEAFTEYGVTEFLCLCIGVAVSAGYTIWHDGYFSLNEYPRRAMAMFAVVAAINLAVAACNFRRGEIVKDGVLTFWSINLFCGILPLIVILLVLARAAYKKRQGEG